MGFKELPPKDTAGGQDDPPPIMHPVFLGERNPTQADTRKRKLSLLRLSRSLSLPVWIQMSPVHG